jgi:hypothetical protein
LIPKDYKDSKLVERMREKLKKEDNPVARHIRELKIAKKELNNNG